VAPSLPSFDLMQRETRISYGPVPHSLGNQKIGEIAWQMAGDRFLLRAAGDHYFFYSRDEGITVERGDGAVLEEEELWLNGSVYAAIASMNGLLPIHASAVAHRSTVVAFTGVPGSGKSTLAAALANFGLPMFCDDTLVLDLSNPDEIVCHPGHKRLKLSPDAAELTGAEVQERVSPAIDKHYAHPAADVGDRPLPLGSLIFLEEGPTTKVEPIAGAERMLRLDDNHYTAHLFAAAQQFSRGEQFELRARLARAISMARFIRPIDRSVFAGGVSLLAEYISGQPWAR